ncbi:MULTISPECIES: hypothetical protein [unclassified Fibrobacter]|uniref:hypothetical protein n=1 Tax=unclassified Fibrobacter TaxID=2634177 RepID=UPI000D6A8D3B|nr:MULTISPECIES: hypothetical protein [unclassified Fibrobacter]PWJ70111.1 hypothetical protein BGX12_10376 [Fibrobacter sp. UWR4]PZW73459.1 hypothetical protein C8E88_100377 [Fibrobacter sp. UWR1]
MNTYDLLDANGNVVFVENGRKVLLDTGCPLSEYPKHMINSNVFENVGHVIAEVRGYPRLCDYDILIDLPGKKLYIDTNPIAFEGTAVNYRLINNSIRMEMTANGKEHVFIFDTGAPHSYVDESWIPPEILTAGPTRYVKDYNPMLGRLESPAYNVPVTFAGKTYITELCLPPQHVRNGLQGIGGVLGGALLNHFKILIDFRNQRVICQ